MEQRVNFCQFCGTNQEGMEQFCGKCGKPLRRMRQQPVVRPVPQIAYRPPVTNVVSQQKKDKKPAIIVAAVFGLTALMLLIAVTIWLFLSHRSETDVKPEVGVDEVYAETVGSDLADAVCENCPSERFEDVFPSTWYHKAVDFCVTEGLMNGVSDTSFASNSKLTRAMMWTILARMDGVDTADGATWYEKGWAWAVENAVSDGTDDQDSITREQLATMVWRYVGEPAAEGNLEAFGDGGEVSDWAETAMIWAVSEGVIRGKGGGVLDPQGNATRAEVAQIFLNYFG